MQPGASFSDYKREGHNWITLATGEFYPDILQDACTLYAPVLTLFEQILRSSESSVRLLTTIAEVSDSWMRIQLAQPHHRSVLQSGRLGARLLLWLRYNVDCS